MGVYNFLVARMTCPRCGSNEKMEIDLYFGFRDMTRYELGEEYKWARGNSVRKGARPAEGSIDGEGYAECPVCNKDFFVRVAVRKDVLEAVSVDTENPGFIP